MPPVVEFRGSWTYLGKEILPTHTPCTGMSENQLTEAIAVVHVELILIHPFREGNGRLSRLLANVMALQAGWPELRLHVLGRLQNRLRCLDSGRDDRL